jgi:hypothetical protein
MARVLECRRSAGRLAGFRLLSARGRHDRAAMLARTNDSDGGRRRRNPQDLFDLNLITGCDWIV